MQVVTAVGRGETILTALQEAVPEDVRGSMAAAVSGAVQARGLSFNLVGFGKNMPPPSLPAGLISSIKGKLGAVSGRKNEIAAAQSPSPVSESPPTGTGEPQKQNQEGHETGNNNIGDRSKESGSSEKSKTEDPKSEEHGPLDSQNSKTTPGGGASDEGHAHPETSESIDEKDKSNKEKTSPEGATKGPSNLKEEVSKDPKGEVSDLKESSEGRIVGGKNEESTERQEKEDNKGLENKDGGREAPVNQMERKDDKQPGNSKDSNEQGVKEEIKPEGAKEENKPEGSKEENKPEGAKEETKPEGDDVPSPGTPDPVTAASTPSPAPPAPPPASNPTPQKTGMAPPIDMQSAIQALTGFDDSTQMAVTNVFGVVESMLEQLEKDQEAAALDPSKGSKGATIDSSMDHEKENAKEKSDGENEKRAKGQKPTGPDSSDGSISTDDHENEHDKEESSRGKEQREKQQKASEPSSPASELTDDYENGSGGEKANQIMTKSSHTAHNEEDGDTAAAEGLDKNLENVDNRSNSQKNNSARGVAVNKCDRDSVQKLFSRVLTTHRVGSSMFVTSMLNFEAPQVTGGIHGEQNGAPSGFVATSRDSKGVLPKVDTSNGAGPHIQQSKRSSLSRDIKVTKVVPHKMTMEQLVAEVDHESQQEPDKEEGTQGSETVEIKTTGSKEVESPNMVEKMVAEALKLEVLRRLGVAGMESLGVDLEKEVAKVADAVAEAVQTWQQKPGKDGSESGKLGILESDSIVNTLGSVVSGTSILGGLVPIGVLAGVVLASLGAVYLIVTDQQEATKGTEEEEEEDDDHGESSSWHEAKESALDVPVLSVNRHAQEDTDESVEGSFDFWKDERQGSEDTDDAMNDENNGIEEPTETTRDGQTEGGNNDKLMGMMAAAVSGGATLAGMSMANNGAATNDQNNQVTDKTGTESKNPSIVSSFHPLAEKALSVAAPIVPTNEDGEIDHERFQSYHFASWKCL
jgi:hypothetical protein